MKRGSFQVFYSIKELTLKLFWRTQCLYSFDIIFMFFKEQFCWSVLRPLVSLCVLHIWGINFSNFHFPKKNIHFLHIFKVFITELYRIISFHLFHLFFTPTYLLYCTYWWILFTSFLSTNHIYFTYFQHFIDIIIWKYLFIFNTLGLGFVYSFCSISYFLFLKFHFISFSSPLSFFIDVCVFPNF